MKNSCLQIRKTFVYRFEKHVNMFITTKLLCLQQRCFSSYVLCLGMSCYANSSLVKNIVLCLGKSWKNVVLCLASLVKNVVLY